MNPVIPRSMRAMAIAATFTWGAAHAPAQYTATDIGIGAVNTSPVGGSSKYAEINQSTRAAWTYQDGSGNRIAAVWIPGTGRVDLDMSNATTSYPQTTDIRGEFGSSINDSHTVVGGGDDFPTSFFQTRGCIWTTNSATSYNSYDLKSHSYYGAVGFDGINNGGMMVANFAWHEQYDHHVELYDGSDYSSLGFPGASEGMQGVGINDSDQVVGTCWDLVVDYYPYVTNYNAFISGKRLGYIPVSGSSSGTSYGNAINEYGIAVGEWRTDVSPLRAFIWIPDDANSTNDTDFGMQALGELSGETTSVAYGVGNVSVDGQGVSTVYVVGQSGNKAVMWTVEFEDGNPASFSSTIQDLSGAAGGNVSLNAAFDINDDGDIVAGGTTNSTWRTYLLEP